MIIKHNETKVTHIEHRSANDVMNTIYDIIASIQQQGRVVSEIIIDDHDVTGELESYIQMNIERIQAIHIHSMTREEMFATLYQDTVDYMARIVQATDSISEVFYGDSDDQKWDYLSQLMNGFGYVIQSLQMIAAEQSHNEVVQDKIGQFLRQIEERVNEINEAVQDDDMILVADMIKYELGPLASGIKEFLSSEVKV